MRNLWVVVAALMLAGCVGSNGNDGESNQFCHTVPVRSILCNSCTQVSDTGQAFDGHLSTFAVMGTGGSGTFVAGTVDCRSEAPGCCADEVGALFRRGGGSGS